jgi:hypothetical protein
MKPLTDLIRKQEPITACPTLRGKKVPIVQIDTLDYIESMLVYMMMDVVFCILESLHDTIVGII